MKFADFLSSENIKFSQNGINSRKKILETLAQMLSNGQPDLDPHIIFDHLLEREKLGSTALGEGVAIPHCRISGLGEPHTAVLRVKPPVDYDAPDNLPVTIFFGLLVAGDATKEHLNLLASLAETLTRPELRELLLNTEDPEDILAALKNK